MVSLRYRQGQGERVARSNAHKQRARGFSAAVQDCRRLYLHRRSPTYLGRKAWLLQRQHEAQRSEEGRQLASLLNSALPLRKRLAVAYAQGAIDASGGMTEG